MIPHKFSVESSALESCVLVILYFQSLFQIRFLGKLQKVFLCQSLQNLLFVKEIDWGLSPFAIRISYFFTSRKMLRNWDLAYSSRFRISLSITANNSSPPSPEKQPLSRLFCGKLGYIISRESAEESPKVLQ